MRINDWDGKIPEGAVVIARRAGGEGVTYCDTWYWVTERQLENDITLHPYSVEQLRGDCDEILICRTPEEVIRAVCGHQEVVGVRQQNATESTPTDVS